MNTIDHNLGLSINIVALTDEEEQGWLVSISMGGSLIRQLECSPSEIPGELMTAAMMVMGRLRDTVVLEMRESAVDEVSACLDAARTTIREDFQKRERKRNG